MAVRVFIAISKVGGSNNNMKHHDNSGFTLIEIIITTSIIAILGMVITQVLSTTTRTNTKVGIMSDVKQNGDYALLMMERLIRSARQVTSSCSEAGSTLDSVVLENTDGNTTTLTCAYDGSASRVASVSGIVTSYLTGTNVTLGGSSCSGSSLSFTCQGIQGGSQTISIAFSLSQGNASQFISEQSTIPFQSTIMVRNRK